VARPAVPEVVLVGGDDASGMASMLADLLTDNLRDFPGRARVAARTRGSVVLSAADHELDVTLSFGGGRVEVRDGAADGVTTVSGPWLTMAKLCSGQVSPVRAVRLGELDVRRGRHLPTAAAAGYVLSVPESFYAGRDETARRTGRTVSPAVVAAGVAVVGVCCVVGITVARRRRRRHAQSSAWPLADTSQPAAPRPIPAPSS
jgi:hypothetical protein